MKTLRFIQCLAEQTRIVAEVERRLSVVEELESVVFATTHFAFGRKQREFRLDGIVSESLMSSFLIVVPGEFNYRAPRGDFSENIILPVDTRKISDLSAFTPEHENSTKSDSAARYLVYSRSINRLLSRVSQQ